MKIAHVIARLNVGGPAVAVIAAVDELSRRGHDVLLLCGEVPPSEASMEYLAREQNVSLTRISRMSRRISLWKDLASFVRLCRINELLLAGFLDKMMHQSSANPFPPPGALTAPGAR